MAEDDDALEALRRHNEQLARLLSSDGREELDRLVLLEMAIHAYTSGRLSDYGSMPVGNLVDRLQRELQGLPNEEASRLAESIRELAKIPDWAEDLRKKIGSVANAYVKKKAGDVLSGDGDGETD